MGPGYVLTGNAAVADRTGARAQLISFLWKQDRYPKLERAKYIHYRTVSLSAWIQKSGKLSFESLLTIGPAILSKFCTETFKKRILGNSDIDLKNWKPLPTSLDYHESLLWMKRERKGS